MSIVPAKLRRPFFERVLGLMMGKRRFRHGLQVTY